MFARSAPRFAGSRVPLSRGFSCASTSCAKAKYALWGVGGGALFTGALWYSTRKEETIVHADHEAPSSLDPNKFISFTLKEVHPVSHDTKLFRFALPSSRHKLGLPVASCVLTKAPPVKEGEDPVVRPYTPVSSDEDLGHFDLVIKRYDQGVMSKHIHDLKPGDTLEVKGPITKFPYKANSKKQIGMIAGGTGITPMYQVIKEILKNPADKTQVTLIFANKSVDDILLKNELDDLQKKHSNFKVHYIVDKAPAHGKWNGGVGYVTKDLVKKQISAPSNDALVMVCGPPGFYKVVSGEKAQDRTQGELAGILKDLGWKAEQVFKF